MNKPSTKKLKAWPRPLSDHIIQTLNEAARTGEFIDMATLAKTGGFHVSQLYAYCHEHKIPAIDKNSLFARIMRVASPEKTVHEIAIELGKTHQAIYNCVAREGKRGLTVPYLAGGIPERRKRAGLFRNDPADEVSTRRIMRQLSPEVRKWLISQVPPDGRISEFISAIINDAYHEEQS